MQLVILLEELYDEFEYWYPKMRLEEEGYKIVSVSPTKGTFHGKKGFPAKNDIVIDDAIMFEWDGIIIPGGYAPDRLRRDKNILQLIRDINSKNKLVATICHGGWVLISAGIVKDRTMTSFYAIKDDIVNAGANYVDEPVVVDNNLITSRNPKDMNHYIKAILAFLKDQNG